MGIYAKVNKDKCDLPLLSDLNYSRLSISKILPQRGGQGILWAVGRVAWMAVNTQWQQQMIDSTGGSNIGSDILPGGRQAVWVVAWAPVTTN